MSGRLGYSFGLSQETEEHGRKASSCCRWGSSTSLGYQSDCRRRRSVLSGSSVKWDGNSNQAYVLGFGGLTAAIECHRQGHEVEVYESFPELKPLGDIISFGPNGGRIFHRVSSPILYKLPLHCRFDRC